MEYVNRETLEVIKEGLREATPRQAALAILRYREYLAGLKRDGVPLTAGFVVALFEELKTVARADCAVVEARL